MPTDVAVLPLRMADRKRLLSYLVKLGAPDPGQRAAAALQATELLRQKGLSWTVLVPVSRDDDDDVPLPDWRAQILKLAEHPALALDERTYLPGQSGEGLRDKPLKL